MTHDYIERCTVASQSAHTVKCVDLKNIDIQKLKFLKILADNHE